MLNLKKKRIVACIILVAFVCSIVSTAYANIDENEIIESGQYIENNTMYEYIIYSNNDGEFLTQIYTMSDEKILYDQFVTKRIGNVIYIDNEAVARIEVTNNHQDDIQPINFEPQVYYYSGNVSELSTVFSRGVAVVASTLVAALYKGNMTSFVAGALTTVASEVIAYRFDSVHFEQYIIYEPFPEDDPAVTLRETNKVAFYTDVTLTNMIGDCVDCARTRLD